MHSPKPTFTGQARPVASIGLVFNGGGVKGVAFAGALLELHARVANPFESFAGTSAGAITAAVLAMGYDVETTAKIVERQPLSAFLSSSWQPDWACAPWARQRTPRIGRLGSAARSLAAVLRGQLIWFRLLTPFGRGALHSSAPIGRFIDYLERWRPLPNGAHRREPDRLLGGKFKDLRHPLMVVASSTGPETCKIFDQPEDDLEFAVRCSMAIPGFFESHRVGRHVLYDGGLVANFAFVRIAARRSGQKTIGLYLYDSTNDSRAGDSRVGVVSLLRNVLRIYQGQDERSVVANNRDSIIVIDTHPLHTVDFDLGARDKQLLMQSGRLAVLRFLLNQAHGLEFRADRVPTESDYETALERVAGLRAKAVVRWKWRHRLQLWSLYFAAILTVLVTTAPLIVVTAVLTSSYEHTGSVPGQSLVAGKEIVDIGIILNGDAEYARTAAEGFQVELEDCLSDSPYSPHFVVAVGRPASTESAFNLAQLATFKASYGDTPDYIVAVGTQVAVDAQSYCRGAIPLLFVAVTDPMAANLLPTDPSKRGDVSGTAYSSNAANSALRFLTSTFPGAQLGFIYGSAVPQDVSMNERVQSAAKTLGVSVESISATDVSNIAFDGDIAFGWYYLNAHFDAIAANAPFALVAGNQKDMAKGAIAMIANNDREVGRIAAREILARALNERQPLATYPVLTVDGGEFGVSFRVARQHGVLVSAYLQPGTIVYR